MAVAVLSTFRQLDGQREMPCRLFASPAQPLWVALLLFALSVGFPVEESCV